MVEDERINEFISKQSTNNYKIPQLCPIEEELLLLGDAFLQRRRKYRLKFYIYSTMTIFEFCRNLELHNDNPTVENFEKYYNEITRFQESYIELEEYVNIVKQMAEALTDEEYIKVFNKVEKMYRIRELYDELESELDELEKREKLQEKFEILASSNRITEMSLEQIKNFVTSYKVESYNEVTTNSRILSKDLTTFLEEKKSDSDVGIDLPFPLLQKAINGLRKGQLIATGMMSNDGKTRLMIRLASNLALIQNKKILIISNEMTVEDIKFCFITSILNNDEFKELFNTAKITKTERDIRNAIYSDETEFEEVKRIIKELEEKFENNIRIIHTTNYKAEDLKNIILTHYIENDIDYFFYDTLKADIDSLSNWDGLKVIATVLSELAKEYNITILTNIQLVNRPSPLSATVENIANSKQLYHVLDTLFLFIPVPKEDYKKYIYWNDSKAPTTDSIKFLESNKKYYVCNVEKNRLGAKPKILFEVNLDKNIWRELGQVALYQDIKGIING